MSGSRTTWLSLNTTIRLMRRGLRLYGFSHSPAAFSQALSHVLRRFRNQSPPLNAFIVTTNRCQCRCPHCYAQVDKSLKSRELTTKEIVDLIDQLKAIGTLQVVFTGGEPLLREDIFELIAYAHRAGMLTRLNTNAYALDQACAEKLKSAGLDQCGVSLDYIEPEDHDRFRSVPGLHSRALQAFGYLRDCGIQRRMYVSVTHRKLSAGLERFVELCKELKVNSCFFTIPYAVGRWRESYQEVLSGEEMAVLRRLQRYSTVVIEFSTAQTNCCAYGKTVLSINAGGNVCPCPAVPFSMGNVRNEPLAVIWNRHVSATRLESRGKCPMNTPEGRREMEMYCKTASRDRCAPAS